MTCQSIWQSTRVSNKCRQWSGEDKAQHGDRLRPRRLNEDSSVSVVMSNPFADPQRGQAQALDSNPFEDPDDERGYDRADGEDDKQTLDEASTYDLPYSAGTQTRPSGSDTARRLEEIKRREAELAERESHLEQRQEHIRIHGRNNWPFFYPLIFHDIDQEIPKESRATVLTMYRIWLLLLVVLVLNLVGCILLLVAGQPDGIHDLIGAITYIIFIPPLSFLLWYRVLYNALQKELSVYYYVFFFFGGWHALFSIYMLLGIRSTGSAGLLNTILALTDVKIVSGIFGVLATAGWALETGGIVFEYLRILKHHRTKGHSIDAARAEIAVHGFRRYFTRG
ncbi:uncharacterized protein L969DRAFT_54729 [Mixia osmundae IAM 14324]|uniref:Secretory carrier-associated membrane protein n=1 Tax=Mixia osmundae (strain CBS 9802 / IAM 14324 / JCM 22182 / KY 12970) TaxID=764103 RepID=G7E888_MIXOS|nr:uncharacterized protein L969DRAFT_54729 [Mixia osmundae IAM 14324]KEI36541.1 hypothetical protein L969DRAFT_54729 [Mixia osmundae IAM 14324]GAA99048.1 hypothetical protein E5Q_05737 [Mixia osmundae IAM 14324]